MGCDIHFFVERRDSSMYGDNRWSGIEMDIPRDYGLFKVLASVRASRIEDQPEMFQPRGMPRDISSVTKEQYLMLVTDDGDPGEGCSRQCAERLIAQGSTEYWDERKRFVICADWHSASWLTLEELRTAYQRYLEYYKECVLPQLRTGMSEDELFAECKRVQGMMQSVSRIPEVESAIAYMERMSEFREVRAVFWFDN